MRRALRTAAALTPLLALPLATNAEDGRALELCRQAFDPAAHTGAGTSGLGEFARKLRLLREGAALGHLPSLFHLAVYFCVESTSALAGVPDRAERDAILTRLAEATFPLAERAVAWRTKDEGFSGHRWAKGFDEHAAAVKRWRFFTWMTRAALHGDRMAWEALAQFYPYEIERYSGDADARVRGYVWAYLRSIPVNDVDRSALGSVWTHKEREAWARLEGPAEQERARAMAARYEREVFPKLIRDTSALAICSLEPQFARDVTAARRIPSPVGPPPNPPDPSASAYKRVHLPPVPTAPDGVTVVSGSFETERSVEVGKYVPVAAVPAGRTGVIERAIVVVRDAPIFAERGRLSLQLYLERPGSKRQPLVGAEPRIPAVVDAHIAEQGILVSGGETITFWCRSTTIDRKGAFDKGCTVEVYVWIHDGAGHAGGKPPSGSRTRLPQSTRLSTNPSPSTTRLGDCYANPLNVGFTYGPPEGDLCVPCVSRAFWVRVGVVYSWGLDPRQLAQAPGSIGGGRRLAHPDRIGPGAWLSSTAARRCAIGGPPEGEPGGLQKEPQPRRAGRRAGRGWGAKWPERALPTPSA